MASENFVLTIEGETELNVFQKCVTIPPKFLEGWKYHHLTTLFWERLSLLVQVSSNLINKNKGFIPIQNKQETQEWFKKFLKMQNANRYELAEQLYIELTECLHQEKSIEPAVLVLRLTGHNKIGLTSEQAAERLDMTTTHYHLEFLNILHYMIKTVSTMRNDFPLLSSLVQDVQKEVPLTLSTEKTFQLLDKGYVPNEIAAMRNLKMSTIEDHIVEIALHVKEFELNRYVHPDIEKRIMEVASKTSAKKLKQIRDQVDGANYFEIRLVLARNGGQKWN
ncbi:helix-turn-helix domain-containing protein [Mesobacillus maritimus]|uniref:helix-turn-helix domain-containing protein n=1 Tax=Mesobacillus maritimus TaxID=1643336 RepID=UPI0031BAB0B9